ncbi:MAG: hypothetical protein AB2L11_03405 [Syntrophobacteraceae bacterium]
MKARTVLDDLIHENSISMKIVKVQSNPTIVSDDSLEGVEHYRCWLLKPGKQMDVYLSLEPMNDPLTVNDVLFLLAMDASSCRLLEDYDDPKEEWDAVFGGSDGNLEEMEDFWREYANRCRQVDELKNFLGNAAYEKMLQNVDINEEIGGLI